MSDHPKRTRLVRSYSHADDCYMERTITVDDQSEPLIQIQHQDAPMSTQAAVHGEIASVTIAGRAPQGEEDTPETCRRLAEALAARERTGWTYEHQNVPLTAWIDGYIRSASEDAPVSVQVTRAGSAERWRRLNTEGSILQSVTHVQAGEEIWVAILRKQGAEDPSMILAVRGQAGIHNLPGVVRDFLGRHAADLRARPYRSVWLIGPTLETTFCLYERPAD